MIKKLNIEGMSCMHCVNHVKEALEEIEGVKKVQVILNEKVAYVETLKDIPFEVFEKAIEEAGYELVKVE